MKIRMLVLLSVLALGQICLAKDLHVKIYAPQKITTSKVNLQEGDSVDFAVLEDVYSGGTLSLKKDEKVTGVITSMQDNGFVCEPAAVFIENFQTKNAQGKPVNLKGHVYVKGRNHAFFTQFYEDAPELIRGGEVQIRKNDSFTIFMDDKL